MSVTIIPAPDNSGAIAGWEMLARTIAQNAAARRQRESNYQDLIIKMSDPNTTVDQQNAVLTQDPKQFKATYGIDISQVGKDITQFRKAADVVAPNGMVMTGTAPAENKRVLVDHPGGTAQQQQQAATLTNTQTNTSTDVARMKLAEAQSALASRDMQLNVAKAVTSGKATLRTLDGKVPTFNDMNAYFEGKLELNPLKPEADDREKLAFIYGQDPNDPVGKMMIHSLQNDLDKSDLSVDQAFENVKNARLDGQLKQRELDMINAGLNPNTGKPMSGADTIEPNKLMSLTEGFNNSIESALKPLGMPSRTKSAAPPEIPFSGGAIMDQMSFGPYKTSMPMFMWTKSVGDNPKIGAAIFGNGQADPVSVRRDLLAAVPDGQKLLTIDFPTVDPKTGQPSTTTFTVDELVPRVVQMRRNLATTMPGFFTAFSQASPATLIYMAAGNPLILQAAKAYRPDIYKMIVEARGQSTTAPPPPLLDPALSQWGHNRTDPRTADMTNDVLKLQKSIDDINRVLQGATLAPGER